jgi:hypothetical protein
MPASLTAEEAALTLGIDERFLPKMYKSGNYGLLKDGNKYTFESVKALRENADLIAPLQELARNYVVLGTDEMKDLQEYAPVTSSWVKEEIRKFQRDEESAVQGEYNPDLDLWFVMSEDFDAASIGRAFSASKGKAEGPLTLEELRTGFVQQYGTSRIISEEDAIGKIVELGGRWSDEDDAYVFDRDAPPPVTLFFKQDGSADALEYDDAIKVLEDILLVDYDTDEWNAIFSSDRLGFTSDVTGVSRTVPMDFLTDISHDVSDTRDKLAVFTASLKPKEVKEWEPQAGKDYLTSDRTGLTESELWSYAEATGTPIEQLAYFDPETDTILGALPGIDIEGIKAYEPTKEAPEWEPTPGVDYLTWDQLAGLTESVVTDYAVATGTPIGELAYFDPETKNILGAQLDIDYAAILGYEPAKEDEPWKPKPGKDYLTSDRTGLTEAELWKYAEGTGTPIEELAYFHPETDTIMGALPGIDIEAVRTWKPPKEEKPAREYLTYDELGITKGDLRGLINEGKLEGFFSESGTLVGATQVEWDKYQGVLTAEAEEAQRVQTEYFQTSSLADYFGAKDLIITQDELLDIGIPGVEKADDLVGLFGEPAESGMYIQSELSSKWSELAGDTELPETTTVEKQRGDFGTGQSRTKELTTEDQAAFWSQMFPEGQAKPETTVEVTKRTVTPSTREVPVKDIGAPEVSATLMPSVEDQAAFWGQMTTKTDLPPGDKGEIGQGRGATLDLSDMVVAAFANEVGVGTESDTTQSIQPPQGMPEHRPPGVDPGVQAASDKIVGDRTKLPGRSATVEMPAEDQAKFWGQMFKGQRSDATASIQPPQGMPKERPVDDRYTGAAKTGLTERQRLLDERRRRNPRGGRIPDLSKYPGLR